MITKITSLITQGEPPSLKTKDILFQLKNNLINYNNNLYQDFQTFFKFYRKEYFQNINLNTLKKLRLQLHYHNIYTSHKLTIQALINLMKNNKVP